MTNYKRRQTRKIKVGESLFIGGDAPISVQSMTNRDTYDHEATYKQTLALQNAGCDIVRITVPTPDAAKCISYIKEKGIKVPLVADIHFDYKAALAAIDHGVDKIRINPGNIGDDSRVKILAEAAKSRNVPIRIGVNSGSLEKHILERYGSPTDEALCESALYHAKLLEKYGFEDIIISVKASNAAKTISANRYIAERLPYPLHVGVTEAGGGSTAAIKSAVGIGTLLSEGIGDTIRVSLTEDPVNEVYTARAILSALDMNPRPHLNIISCPTCGRTKIDLISLHSQLDDAVKAEGLTEVPITVALMGCAVNGPGEAREADIGVAGGVGEALLFRHGEICEKIPEDEIIPRLISEIKRNNDGSSK